jgi:hypothetical protein
MVLVDWILHRLLITFSKKFRGLVYLDLSFGIGY